MCEQFLLDFLHIVKARIQPFCRTINIDLGYYDGTRVFPRTVTNRDSALFLFSNHFCLVWKSEGVSFNEAITELKDIFKLVHKFITQEKLISQFKYEFKPKKIESHTTSLIVYDLETHNTDRAKPYCISFYKLNKLAGRYNRDLTPYEYDKFKKHSIVFDGDNCIGTA